MKRTFTGILAGLLAGATMTFLAAGPAAAGGGACAGNSSNAPDGRIRVVGGPWEGGNGQFPTTGLDVSIQQGQTAFYEMQWRNTGPDNLTIRMHLDHLQKDGYAVKFFLNGENVSARLRKGKTLAFRHLAPGSRTSKLMVQIKQKAASVSEAEAGVGGYYGGNPNPAVNCDLMLAEVND